MFLFLFLRHQFSGLNLLGSPTKIGSNLHLEDAPWWCRSLVCHEMLITGAHELWNIPPQPVWCSWKPWCPKCVLHQCPFGKDPYFARGLFLKGYGYILMGIYKNGVHQANPRRIPPDISMRCLTCKGYKKSTFWMPSCFVCLGGPREHVEQSFRILKIIFNICLGMSVSFSKDNPLSLVWMFIYFFKPPQWAHQIHCCQKKGALVILGPFPTRPPIAVQG